jgi:hypothetical protein
MTKRKTGPEPRPVMDRVVAKSVEMPCPVDGLDLPCWVFTGSKLKGYGQIHVEGRTGYTHQEAYKEFVGPIPEGLEPDHLCRVTACWNPWHLEYVTHLENIRRGNWIGARWRHREKEER